MTQEEREIRAVDHAVETARFRSRPGGWVPVLGWRRYLQTLDAELHYALRALR